MDLHRQPSNHGTSSGERDELALIRRIREGEKNIFNELIRPYERQVFAIVYSVLRNPADAEDVVQEAMFRAFLHLEQLRDCDRFKAWLLRVAVNEAKMWRRKNRQQLYESLEADGMADDSTSYRPRSFADWRDFPSEKLDREELRKALRNAVDQLPEKYRVVFLLADAQSLSYEEIAATLGLSVPAVKTRIHRARMKLQEHLVPAFRPRMSDHLGLMKGMNPWSHARK